MTVMDDDSAVEISNLVPASDLTTATEQWLVDGLITALPGLKMADLFAIRRDMFREADLVTVATAVPGGTAVGALASRWCALPSGDEFLHVLTQFVGERYQRGPVFRQSWGSHFTALGSVPDVIALKTYNPIVYCAMRAFTRIPGVTLYPEITPGAGQDPVMARLAGQVASAVGNAHAFVPQTGVISGIGVPRDLYPELPRSSSREANDYFAATARPGDRVLCVLRVPDRRAGGFILSAFGRAQHGDHHGDHHGEAGGEHVRGA